MPDKEKQIDTLDFLAFSPEEMRRKGFAEECNETDVCICIMINGKDMMEFFTGGSHWDGHKGRVPSGYYGHCEAHNLYWCFTDGFGKAVGRENDPFGFRWIEPFRCKACGDYGCAQFSFDVRSDEKYVYWGNWYGNKALGENFEFCFEIKQYQRALYKLKQFDEQQRKQEEAAKEAKQACD